MLEQIGVVGKKDLNRVNEIEFPSATDPTKMSKDERTILSAQDSRELEIFSLFAEVCPLAIHRGSIEKRQPCEPDILCETREGPVAFEMGESIDEGWARQVTDIEKLQTLLKETFQNLPTDIRSALESRLGNAVIRVVFHQHTSIRKREGAIPKILEWLRQIDPSHAGTIQPKGALSKVVKCVMIVRNNLHKGPNLEIDASGWLADPTLNLIEQKFDKNLNPRVTEKGYNINS